MTLQRFMAVYANLGPAESNLTAIVIDGTPYSWNVIYGEASAGTEFGNRALEIMATQGLI